MADPPASQRREGGEQSQRAPAADPTRDAPDLEGAFSEAGGAAVAALLHLLRLMGAELVLMRPDCDPAQFEQAVRTKIEQFPSPTANEAARQAGLAHARYLVEQVLVQIRAQAELKKRLSAGAKKQTSNSSGQMGSLSKLLN
jgi:hypothetical protein